MRMWLWMAGAAMMAAAVPAGADVPAGSVAWSHGDYKKAVEEWRGPAIAGDPVAQFNLGQAYKLGRGVPVDPGLAESWFRKAAIQGLPQGEDNYALALFQGGKRQEALPWLEKAVARGEPRCQLVLGTMLFNGDGAPRDYPRAYALITRAAAAGLPSASQTLAEMDQYITPADRERGTALAQQYATQAAARPPEPPSGVVRVTDLPPSPLPTDAPVSRRPTPVAAKPTVDRPVKSATAEAVPTKPLDVRPTPPRTSTPTRPAPAGRGGWKAQLGAFHDHGNAEALWAKLKGKLGGATPAYPEAGGVTRLQATGFASKADAQAACARAGVSCIVTGP